MLVSLTVVHWIEFVVLELVEQVVQLEQVVLTGLVGLSAYAAELEHGSMHWSVAAAPRCASFSQVVNAPVEFFP